MMLAVCKQALLSVDHAPPLTVAACAFTVVIVPMLKLCNTYTLAL